MKDNKILRYIKLQKIVNPTVNKTWIKWLNDKDVTKFSDQRFIKHTIISQRKYIKTLVKNNTVFFKVLYKKNVIGNIFLTKIDEKNKNCEIGYLVGEKSFWRKGIATYIIAKVIDYAFKKLKLKKIYTWCYSNNIGSKKALIKNNFKIEGRIKEFYKFNKNQRVDKIYLGLLR